MSETRKGRNAGAAIGAMLVFLFAARAGRPIESSAASQRFAVLIMGNRAGEQVVRQLPSGDLEIHFEFNDRGRGPKLDERISCDRDGIPVRIEINGNDYLKSRIQERFSRDAAAASWENGAEKGEKAAPGRAFYASFDGAPEEIGLLARASLHAPGGQLALLPAGEASIERVGEMTIRRGSESRAVVQYAVTGLDFSPSRVWLGEDGEFFSSASQWMTVIPEGWEGAASDLIAAQDAAEKRRSAALAGHLAHHPTGAVAFIHANLFDSNTAESMPKRTVAVSGNRIQAVGPDAEVKIPAGADVIDAHGMTLLPGLWDMHVHLGSADGLLDIANGVTTVRDLGNDPDTLLAIKKGYDEGSAVGPRVILAGLVDGSGPYSGPIHRKVDDEKDAREMIADYAKRGYVQIKIYSSIKPELVPVIAKFAHEQGLRVSGHVPAFMTAEQFVRDGADEIQHINFLFLNFLFDTVKDTRGPARFTAVAEHAAEIDPSSEKVREFLKFLQERHTVIDPTVNVFEGMFVARKGTITPGDLPVAERMPPQVRRGFLAGGLPVPEGLDQRYRDSFRSVLRMVKALEDHGIPIVAGTDAMAGFTLARELELYVEAGIPAPRVLQIATLGGARVMKMDNDFGSIAPGKFADLILVEGDPARNIGDIRRVRIVVKDGVIYKPEEIDREIGVRVVSP